MKYQADFQHWVPFRLERVFLFFVNPENLPRLMPPSTQTRIEALRLLPPPPPPDGLQTSLPQIAGVGSEIEASFRVLPALPFRRQWIARIIEFEWNQHFADIQVEGPFKSWFHRHELSAETQTGTPGTRVRDRIEYEIGLGWLDPLAQTWVRRQLRATFAERAGILESLLRDGHRS